MQYIDLENDQLFPVAAIYKARTGKRLNPPTLWRWLRKGCHGIKLEAVPVNGVWHSTPHAFAMFLTLQTEARLMSPETPKVTAERDERTTRKLRAAGLLK